MAMAVSLVKEGHSIYKAAKMTGVPRQTLNDRFTGRVNDPVVFGGHTLLSEEEERKIVEHVSTMARFGYGYSRSQLIYLATDMAAFTKKRDASKSLSEKWLFNFLHRWPQLRVTKASSLSKTRATTTTPQVIQHYYEELSDILQKYHLLERPEAIYNLNETGFSPEHHPTKVLHIFIKVFSSTMATCLIKPF